MFRIGLGALFSTLVFFTGAPHAPINWLLEARSWRVASAAAQGAVVNSITITNESGAAISNYPFQFGRPFLAGTVPDAPQVLINGNPAPTQADIKNRYPDGSVEFAVVAVVIPSIPASGSLTLTFQNQVSANNTPLTQAQMLNPLNFDLVALLTLKSTEGLTNTTSARVMLQNGDYKLWTSGPIAQTIILADDTAARKYDIGFGDGYHPLRPRFYATFWPATHQVFVRTVVENELTTELEDMAYTATLQVGALSPGESGSPAPTYTIDLTGTAAANPKEHWALTNWTKGFWLGGTPSPQVDIDNNLAYLESTRFIPNFDPSIVVPASAIATEYGYWTNPPHDLYDGSWDGGLWASAMGTAGARQEIGPYPTWNVLWLYGGDWRMRQMSLGMADLAGAFPANLREGDPTKRLSRADPTGLSPETGLGHVVSITDRQTLTTYTEALLSYGYTKPADAVKIVGPLDTAQPWSFGTAHVPAPFFVPFLLTGDPYYLEEMYMWAGFSAAQSLDDPAHPDGRGPDGTYGAINGELRGSAWIGRSRAEIAFIAPDGAPEKAYFTYLMNDAIARMEGVFAISGTPYDGTAMKAWGATTGDPWTQNFGPFATKAPVMQNWESAGAPGAKSQTEASIAENVNLGVYNAGAVGSFTSPWMQWYVQYAIGREAELGFAAGPLQVYSGAYPVGLVNNSGQPWMVNVYQMPVEQATGGFLANWPAVIGTLTPQYLSPTGVLVNPTTGTPTGRANGPSAFAADLGVEGYPLYLLGGMAMLDDAGAPGAAQAWSWMKANVETPAAAGLAAAPKWAIVPRTDSNTLPAIPTATPPG